MKKIDRNLQERLYKKFECEVITKLLSVYKHFSYRDDYNFVVERISFVTLEFFGSMYFNERDYMLALYGAMSPSASFEDFKYYVETEIPEITNYFESNHGIRNFVGKWVVTEENHSEISSGTIVKIIGVSERGYDIISVNGTKALEIGFVI